MLIYGQDQADSHLRPHLAACRVGDAEVAIDRLLGLRRTWWVVSNSGPFPILARSAINAAIADPKLKARLTDLGAVPMAMSPAEFGKFIADETEKWGDVIRAAHIKVE